MSVYLDGSTLSSLLFSQLNSNSSQYGFLIGEKIQHIEGRISDSQIHTYDVNSYIYVSSFVPWPSQECIYSRGGHIKDELMKRLFAGTEQTLIGWYSFRHNTTARPSLREMTLHKNLAKSEKFEGQPKDFLFFLCTSSFSSNMSTHTCRHGFMQVVDGHFSAVPMTVMNLGDTTRKEYKKRSTTAASHCKTVLESLQSFRNSFLKPSGEMEQITKVNHLAASINRSLMSVQSKVFESEAALGLLETDVGILRQRLEQLEQEEFRIFKIEAEKKEKEREEERRKQNEEEEAEEQEQLEKLLISLEISSSGKSGDSSSDKPGDSSSLAFGLNNTASFLLENRLSDKNVGHFQVIDPTPLLPVERVLGNSSDINTNCAVGNVSADTLNKHTGCEQRNISGTKINTCETKKLHTVKDKVSEAFSFLDEELKLKKEASAVRQQTAHSQGSKSISTSRAHGGEKLVSSVHELREKMGHSSVTDLLNGGNKVIENNAVVKDATESVNGNPTGNSNVVAENHMIYH